MARWLFLCAAAGLCAVALLAVPLTNPQRRAGTQPVDRKDPSSGVRVVSRVSAEWVDGFESLRALCARSDTLVVGSVDGIVRVEDTPPNAGASRIKAGVSPHTVYRILVERYLRADGAPHLPVSINMYQHGGVVNGVAHVWEGSPLLYVGGRYILFLRVLRTDSWTCRLGVWGISAYRGEYLVAHRIFGKIRLEAGLTAVPNDPYQTIQPWRFNDSGPLLGLPEDEAIAKIRRSLAGARFRHEPGVP